MASPADVRWAVGTWAWTEGPFGSKENQRIFVEIQCIGKKTRCYVWNGENRRSVPQERKLRVCILHESKNSLRVKGKKGSLFLRLCLSRSLSVWFPAIQTTTILVFCILNSCGFLIFLITTFCSFLYFFLFLYFSFCSKRRPRRKGEFLWFSHLLDSYVLLVPIFFPIPIFFTLFQTTSETEG
jgi:hypothetical protein